MLNWKQKEGVNLNATCKKYYPKFYMVAHNVLLQLMFNRLKNQFKHKLSVKDLNDFLL